MKQNKLEAFMAIAEDIATLSPDIHTKVGSIAVHPETYDCILPSYNGYISEANDQVIPKTRPEKYEYTIHSEMNMICQAAKKGRALDGYWSIQTLSPCTSCMRILYQSGIRTIVFKDKYRDFDKQKEMLDLNLTLTQIGNFVKIVLEPK